MKTTPCDECKAPNEVKETLYPIALEAMQNGVKHANPSEISLELSCSANFIELVVMDVGKGFDPNQLFPGHLGQRSKSERATHLGRNLVIDNSPAKGNRVHVKLPL